MNVSLVRRATGAVPLLVVLCGAILLWAPPARAQADVDDADVRFNELYADGAVVFGTSCVSCHDADGGDTGSAPALSGHPSMGARDYIVRQILFGNPEKGMPAFGPALDDRQIAAVATYIRNSWDNAHGVVDVADVQRVKAENRP